MTLVPHSEKSQVRMVLLAPPAAPLSEKFAHREISTPSYEQLLRGMQRLRARVYVEDGAIHSSDVSPDGCHRQPVDSSAWHLLSLDAFGEVRGCSRYVSHSNTVGFSQLGIRKAALARSREWGITLRAAIEAEVGEARARGLSFVEVGGWALDASLRGTKEALRIALGTYSLARILGGCIGITTATRRHCSAGILRRIGGRPVRRGAEELPSYFDPQYGCDMELLRFDSTELHPRFESAVNELTSYLQSCQVIGRQQPALVGRVPLLSGMGGNLAHAVQ